MKVTIKLPLISLFFFTFIHYSALQDHECDRKKCPWNRYNHYIARECLPVYEGGSCCPTRFSCKTEAERGISPDKCYYKGKNYQIGDRVNVEDSCPITCICSGTNGEISSIICPIVECPSTFQQPKPGCRLLYEINSCCEVGEDCSNAEPRSNQCEWNNNTALLGSYVRFGDEEPCQRCVCTENFSGPRGPGCKRISCGIDYRFRIELSKGCVPIYFENGCCPIEFVCPGDERLKEVLSPQLREYGKGECIFGNLVVPVGGSVKATDCDLSCDCVTPPDLTCIKYRSCEAATTSLLRQNDDSNCKNIKCEKGCNTITDPITKCPKCFCPGKTYTCPEPKCPPLCENSYLKFNEIEGCYECQCECRKDFQGNPPCPLDCITKMIFDDETGCETCICDPQAPGIQFLNGGTSKDSVSIIRGKQIAHIPFFVPLRDVIRGSKSFPSFNSDDICSLPSLTGECKALIHRYAFSPERNSCGVFTYGGCGGNPNNFQTLGDCMRKCGGNRPVAGKCPRVRSNSFGTCENSCNPNDMYDPICVQRNKLCCSNGCGSACLNPV